MRQLVQRGQAAGVRVRVLADFPRLPALPPYRRFREGMLLDVRCDNSELVMDKVRAVSTQPTPTYSPLKKSFVLTDPLCC